MVLCKEVLDCKDKTNCLDCCKTNISKCSDDGNQLSPSYCFGICDHPAPVHTDTDGLNKAKQCGPQGVSKQGFKCNQEIYKCCDGNQTCINTSYQCCQPMYCSQNPQFCGTGCPSVDIGDAKGGSSGGSISTPGCYLKSDDTCEMIAHSCDKASLTCQNNTCYHSLDECTSSIKSNPSNDNKPTGGKSVTIKESGEHKSNNTVMIIIIALLIPLAAILFGVHYYVYHTL